VQKIKTAKKTGAKKSTYHTAAWILRLGNDKDSWVNAATVTVHPEKIQQRNRPPDRAPEKS